MCVITAGLAIPYVILAGILFQYNDDDNQRKVLVIQLATEYCNCGN